MTEPTFADQQLWLNNLSNETEPSNKLNDNEKRKWGALNDMTEPFAKHFNNGGDNGLFEQLGKQVNDASELNLSPSELRQKRKEQNRVAQRAFRERKERYVKELEDKVTQLEQQRINETRDLKKENQSLRQLVKQMETEIYTLKGAEQAFKVSIQKLREAGIQLPVDNNNTTLPTPNSTTTTAPMNSPETEETTATTFLESQKASSPSSPSHGLRGTPPNSNSNQWHTPPIIGSSPYSASSPLTNMSSFSPPLDHPSTDRSMFDDFDSSSMSTTTKDEILSATYQSEHTLQHPPNVPSSTREHDSSEATDKSDVTFATSETNRFNHQPDPLLQKGAKTIPYTQIWEMVQEHPKYELFDMDQLCEDLKKKARCSGFGAVILEEDFLKVLEKYDV